MSGKKKSKGKKNVVQLVKYSAPRFGVLSQYWNDEQAYELQGFSTLDAAKRRFDEDKVESLQDVRLHWTHPIMLVSILESITPPE